MYKLFAKSNDNQNHLILVMSDLSLNNWFRRKDITKGKGMGVPFESQN